MSSTSINVTHLVDFYENDGECLPITKCVCGQMFEPWEFFISIYKDIAYACPTCGRKLYFRADITVYEVIEDNEV